MSPSRKILPVLVALAIGLPFLWCGRAIGALQALGQSAGAIAMGADMNMRDMDRFWAFPWLQASGLIALVAMVVVAYLGVMSGRWRAQGRPVAEVWVRLHRQVALGTLVMLAGHLYWTTQDSMGDSWRTVLMPATWALQGWPEAVPGYRHGLIACVVLLALGLSFYARRAGRFARWWHGAHVLILIAYACSVWHTLELGLDVAYYAWIRPALWLVQLPLLCLLAHQAWLRSRARCGDGFTMATVLWSSTTVTALCACAAIAWILLSGNAAIIKTV